MNTLIPYLYNLKNLSEFQMKSLTTVLFIFCSLQFFAQEQPPKHYFYGGVFDALTREIVDSVKVSLLDDQDQITRTMTTSKDVIVGYGQATWYFYCQSHTPKQRIRFEANGYETEEREIASMRFMKREFSKQLFNVYLKRKPKERTLGEAVVTATKVKFYSKGDTLVYNADAFQLTEGSMLDALIRQLPGVELKKDGRILVNGRQIESMLLNGEDFFDRNGQIMLQNLPAYMVKQVQTFEKQTELSEKMGKDAEKRLFVMNIKLKKQYSIGWMGQALGGYGTDNHYLARLFAMRFTPHSRISVYGNANDLSDLRQPGQDEDWTPEDLSENKTTSQQAGIDVLIHDKDDHFKLQSNTKFQHTLTNGNTFTNKVDYLAGGNIYKGNWLLNHANSFGFSSNNQLELHPHSQTWWNILLNANHGNYRGRMQSTDATFSQNTGGSISLRDSLRLLTLPRILKEQILNTYLQNGYSNNSGSQLSGGVTWQKRVFANDMIYMSAGAGYSDNHSKADEKAVFRVDDILQQYIRNDRQRPQRVSQANFTGFYFFWINSKVVLIPHYSFDYVRSKSCRTLTNNELLDTQNSYTRKQQDINSTIKLSLKWQTDNWFAQIEAPFKIKQQQMDYKRASFGDNIKKNFYFFEPIADIFYQWNKRARQKLELKYSITHNQPDMADYVEEARTDNPLYIYNGNSMLQPEKEHTLEITYERQQPENGWNMTTSLGTIFTPSGIGLLTGYNPENGITSYKIINEYGSKIVNHTLSFNVPLGQNGNAASWSLHNNWLAQYAHGVNYATGQETGKNIRNVIHTTWLTDELAIDFHTKDWNVTASASCGWNNAYSRMEGFNNVNVWAFDYGLALITPKIWNFQFSTDCKMYSRRGYASRSSNTNNLVWNLRITRNFGDRWFVSLDGFDILHNLSNTTQTLNATGRIETIRTIITQYAMISFGYKFNK